MMKALLSRLPGRVAGAAVGAVVAGLVLSDSKAHALIVNVSGQDYEFSTFTGSYNDNINKFKTAANGGVMPWWGSADDAREFASAVGPNLGLPLFPGGPLFGYGQLDDMVSVMYYNSSNQTIDECPNNCVAVWVNTATWAEATLVPAAGSVNVPGPLPAVGLAVAFGFSRKLRKRIKLHKGTSAVPTSPGA